jgi:hypothetical protein
MSSNIGLDHVILDKDLEDFNIVLISFFVIVNTLVIL